MNFGGIPEIDKEAETAAKGRWDALAKPVGSLGELERLVIRMAGIRGTADLRAGRRAIAVFCADNGVTAEGVCGSDPALTAVIAANIAAGRGNVSAMAKAARCEVVCVDVGMFGQAADENLPSAGAASAEDTSLDRLRKEAKETAGIPEAETSPDRLRKEAEISLTRIWAEKAGIPGGGESALGLVQRVVRRGTRNFTKEPAMTPDEACAALSVGESMAKALADGGAELLLAGEAGIGNTTTSAAVAAALLGLPADAVVGRGAGLDDEGLARKTRVIDEALKNYGFCPDEGLPAATLNRTPPEHFAEKNNAAEGKTGAGSRTSAFRGAAGSGQEPDPGRAYAFRALCCVGGFDLAAMAGFYIGCAKRRVPAILDGAISAAAALLAERLAPGTRSFLLASHQSREPMAGYLLGELGLTPILRADLALGEGTGALCLLPLIDLALAAYHNAATFAESGLFVNEEDGSAEYRIRS